jgi:hypothetical protein
MRASLRVMARPRPVPPKRCAVEASAWLNSKRGEILEAVVLEQRDILRFRRDTSCYASLADFYSAFGIVSLRGRYR